MKPNRQGHSEYDGLFGQSRVYISPGKSVLHFEPGRKAVTLAWSTAQSPAAAIDAVLAPEVLHNRPKRCQLFLSPEVEYHHRDWLGIKKKFEETVATDPDSICYVRFDFADWSIAISSLPAHHTPGISYSIHRQPGGRPRPDAVQALRKAFKDTADTSLESELDWALKSIIT